VNQLTEVNRFKNGNHVDWSLIRHFISAEWQQLQFTSALLIYALDEYRHNLGAPVSFSPVNWGKHAPHGYHYGHQKTGGVVWAVDIFPQCDIPWAYHTAMKSKFFAGIGVYPFWNWGDLHGGLHLDIRYFETNKKVWWCDAKGKYRYIHTSEELSDFEVTMLTETV